jgi:hypothetical protein
MRDEFYNVYIQNELFYRNKIAELEKKIQEKNKIIDYLREMLCRASMIIKQLIKIRGRLIPAPYLFLHECYFLNSVIFFRTHLHFDKNRTL